MDGIIRIGIPEELWEQFQHDRKLVEEKVMYGEERAEQLELYLANNMILDALKEISSLTTYSSNYGYVEKKGFYKNFLEWLDFALEKIMALKGIDVSNFSKKRDMYSALRWSQQVLTDVEVGKCFERNVLIEQAQYFTNKEKDGRDYNPQINDMCSVFIDIGILMINPYKTMVDIGYEAFQKSKRKEKGLVLTKNNNSSKI